MDNLDLTIEEYIELYFDDFDYLKDFENKFPAIVYNDALTLGPEISSEPTVSPLNENHIDFRISFDESGDEDYTVIYDKNLFPYKIISVNDLKTDSKNDNDEVNISSNDVLVEQLDNGIDANIDTESHEFNEDFETNHDTPGLNTAYPGLWIWCIDFLYSFSHAGI
ncbi:hypothetical protein Tco_1005368 [Tanacetum coccineum]|uniref:Uncharacterized protein n=1 Tax=Tanacetum coccineum TaxID=301880 RepID=A0ABQ5FET3_9ASTR